MRDLDKNPYSADEARVAKFLFDLGAGGGDDPIGFILASHAALAAERNQLRAHAQAAGWSPIETAPKDGTPALFCIWNDETQDILPVTSGFWSRLSNRWFSEVSGHGIAPTHWMLLMAPPSSVPSADREAT